MESIIQNAANDIININGGMIIYDGGINYCNLNESWDEDFGELCRRYSYKNELMSFVGREKEKEFLNNFLNKSEKFLISAITGKAGAGKSSLLYHYYMDNLQGKEWFVKAVNFEKNNEILLANISKYPKVLLIIDYVSIHVEKIGKWLSKIYRRAEKYNTIIRVLLIERAYVTEERVPYWYDMLVERYDFHDVCKLEDFLNLEDLSEDELKQIFLNYVINVKRIEEKRNEYEVNAIVKKYNKDIDTVFSELDDSCKVPLFVLYAAEEWMDSDEKGVRPKSKKELLKYIKKKEEQRIKSLFNNQTEKAKHFEKILCFAMSLSEIYLGENASMFIKKDIEAIEDIVGNGNSTTEAALLENGEYNEREMKFKSVMPDIVEEFYCLEYLKKQKRNLKGNFVKEFIEAAWKESAEEFARFLYRLIEDFCEDKMMTCEGILMKPAKMTSLQRKLYADIVREFTFWNMNVEKYSECIAIFDNLLDECTEKEEKIEIAQKYAIAIFNILWASEKLNNQNIENLVLYKNKILNLKKRYDSELINEIWNSVKEYQIYTFEEDECIYEAGGKI